MRMISVVVQVSFWSVAMLAVSCSHAPPEDEAGGEQPDSILVLSKQQLDGSQVVIGRADTFLFRQELKVSGRIIAGPGGKAQVLTHVSGVVQQCRVALGDFVKQGQVLCTIESMEAIALQQDFAETAGKLPGIRKDHQRIKRLYEEGIASEKEYLAMQAEYMGVTARYEGLKSRLRLLKLDVSKVEEGAISGQVSLFAPINGYITSFHCLQGSSANPSQVLMEIVDVGKLALAFTLYEKDLPYISPGMPVRFTLPAIGNERFEAVVKSVGKMVDQESRAIDCRAMLNTKNAPPQLAEGMFAELWVTQQSRKALSLPEEAIVREELGEAVYALDSTGHDQVFFKKIAVKTGLAMEGRTEILSPATLPEVIIKGAYYLKPE